jgi:hypothetical protein
MKMPLWTSLPQIGAKSHSARCVWDTCNPGQATVFVGVWLRGLAMHRSCPISHFATGCQLTAISLAFHWWLPKTPSELKTWRFRSFVRSWCDHDELSFRCPFRSGCLQFSNPCRPAGGDPRASPPTRRFPEERVASSAPPALRPALVDLALAMVARLAP